MAVLEEMTTPVIVAPMAGGPSTPALVCTVGAAGGLGFLALGTTTVADAARQLAEMDGSVTYGVNLFVPQEPLAEQGQVEALAHQLGLTVPNVDLSAIFTAVEAGHGPAAVSSTFGAFSEGDVARLHAAGVEAWVGVATPADAVAAERRGVDALVVQGPEAGGHRFTWSVEEEPDQRPLPELLAAASGGITTPEDVGAALKIDGVGDVRPGPATGIVDRLATG